jgi:predicted DNA-binding transcriptional regulator AlpA
MNQKVSNDSGDQMKDLSLISDKELQKLTGKSKTTLWRMRKAGKLACHRINARSIAFTSDQFTHLIKGGSDATA